MAAIITFIIVLVLLSRRSTSKNVTASFVTGGYLSECDDSVPCQQDLSCDPVYGVCKKTIGSTCSNGSECVSGSVCLSTKLCGMS